MEEQISEKIKSLIQNAGSFAILLDKNPEEHEFLSAEFLKQVISTKRAPFIKLPESPIHLAEKWSSLINTCLNERFPAKTSIRLPKEKYGISEVGYKDEGESLSLIITADNNNFSKEDILLESLLPEPEMAFCFFENPESVKNFQHAVQTPRPDKTIFITENDKTLTEKVFQIGQLFDPALLEQKEKTTLLFGALLEETDNFSLKNTKEILSLASLLIEAGADKERVNKIRQSENKTSFAQLLGRALARTFTDETLNVSWSFITKRDLQKSNNMSLSQYSLHKLLKRISGLIPLQNINILFWPDNDGIKALISETRSEKRNNFLSLAQKTGTVLQSHFFVLGPFENFSKAEIYLREQIKNARID